MERLRTQQLYTEAVLLAAETPSASPYEQLRYEQMAFYAFCRANEDASAQRFIESITKDLDTRYSWVAQIDTDVVRQLSLAIDSFQTEYYTRHQKFAGAQQIYRHVRMKVETDAPDPKDEQSVVLLEALMNGDIRTGTIPQLPKFVV